MSKFNTPAQQMYQIHDTLLVDGVPLQHVTSIRTELDAALPSLCLVTIEMAVPLRSIGFGPPPPPEEKFDPPPAPLEQTEKLAPEEAQRRLRRGLRRR